MTDLPYWGITAVLFWIRTRDFSYVQQLLTGDAKRDEDYSYYCFMIGKFQSPEGREKRPIVVSKEQAAAELYAKLRCGELEAQGVKCNPKNRGNPISGTAQDIPTCDWGYLRFGLFPHDADGRCAAFYEGDWYPSWVHIVCRGATVRQLWPERPGTEKPLSEKERAVLKFLQGWPPKPRREGGDPWYGAKAAAIRHVVENFGGSPDAAWKGDIGQFISSQVNQLRRQKSGG